VPAYRWGWYRYLLCGQWNLH